MVTFGLNFLCRTVSAGVRFPKFTICPWNGAVRSIVTKASERSYRVAPYDELFEESIKNPSEFWAEQADKIVWFKSWNRVLDDTKSPFTEWFVDGQLNTCYNAIDRHVESGRGEQLALVHDSPVTGSQAKFTYSDLLEKVKHENLYNYYCFCFLYSSVEQVSLFAGVLVKHGVQKGDRVLIYMPMIPEAVITMLACSRIGAIHSVVFGGFAAKELSVRIKHCKPKVLVTASAGIEPNRIQEYKPIVDKAIELSGFSPKSCIIYQRKHGGHVNKIQGRDFDWATEMDAAKLHDAVPVDANHPLYIIYTSGTTGQPKVSLYCIKTLLQS